VTAVGCHGQTVRHRPGEFDAVGYTVQINAPALLAELCGIDVVADFRSADVAAGGQGAPLVPAFHRALFSRPGRATAVLNLGGIANVSAIAADGATIGFDCGPANALLDHWSAAATGRRYDADGAWAASGRVDDGLLAALLAEPYFALPPPKSTGRDLFNAAWLEARLGAAAGRTRLAPQDVQATLAELTARTVADAVRAHAATAPELVVCGGGAFNADLMAAPVCPAGADGGGVERRARPAAGPGRGVRLRLAGAGVLPPRTRQHRVGHRRSGTPDPRRPLPGRRRRPDLIVRRPSRRGRKKSRLAAAFRERRRGSGREARAAAAGRRCVRVLDHELRPVEVVLVVDLGAGEVLQAHRVDQQGDAVLGHLRVVVVDDLVEREAVLEARAAATLDEDAQLEVGVAFLVDQLLHLVRGAVGEDERRGRRVVDLRG
jgi:hypothetical protein